jgi:Holliday junction DNA helicase RuvB
VTPHESVLRRILELEQQHKNDNDWLGFSWREVPTHPGILNRLAAEGVIITSFHSRSTTAYRANTQAVLELLGDSSETLEIPGDLFDIIVGYDELKNLFLLSLAAPRPVHILLYGPPATAKTMFLSELSRLPGSRYALGGTSSKAGIIDFLIQVRPRYLVMDELEKADARDYSALLSLMETGFVTKLKSRASESQRVLCWVFAGANNINRLPQELMSRFMKYHVRPYSEQEFKEVAFSVLTKRESVDPEIANYICQRLSGRTQDVRDAVRIGRLAVCKTDVDRLITLVG